MTKDIFDNYLNKKSINEKSTFIFIDGSYYCFYRYFSLLNWWKNAYPENPIDNPYENEEFLEKFKKTFKENIQKLQKNLKIDKKIKPILIVGKDCKSENIWRNELFNKYKSTRTNNSEDGFMGGPFFKMVYYEKLFQQSGVEITLKHPKLEADDCIAISVKYLLKKDSNCDIYIITSDKDYLQLSCEQVKLYNLAFKNLKEQKSSFGSAECDLFCKIVMGDISDCIPSIFKKCGPKTALKYYNNQELFKEKLKESPDSEKQLELNKKLVDFDLIPEELIKEFMEMNINNK